MTEHNNSNADGERPNPTPNNGDPGSADFDAAWAQFAAEHAEDLNDVERSRNAKRFEKHAQRKEKEALLSVDDLDPAAFAGGAGRGPRDFTGSSWLDTDDVMDRYGDPFTPPNPDLGPVNRHRRHRLGVPALDGARAGHDLRHLNADRRGRSDHAAQGP